MLSAGVPRITLRCLSKATNPGFRTLKLHTTTSKIHTLLGCYATGAKRPQAHVFQKHSAFTKSIARSQTTHIDRQHEQDFGKKKLESHPDEVSMDSSVRPVISEIGDGGKGKDDDVEMMAGIKSDIRTIAETFSLQDVPRDAYYIGLAGVLPYLATSLSTVYCAWEIKHAAETGVGLLMSGNTAELLLHVLEPLQIGYGAVIISCLGTVHWGLEWAGYGGTQGMRRYMIGVLAPAVAWPTIFLPVEYALIAQFLAFNMLYYTDARATVRGWTPSWYGTYRFVLTFVVGASIVLSLIGRGQIQDHIGQPPGHADRIKALRDAQREGSSRAEETIEDESD